MGEKEGAFVTLSAIKIFKKEYQVLAWIWRKASPVRLSVEM